MDNGDKKEYSLRSCFVTDVKISNEAVVLTDSTNRRWHVDVSDAEANAGFKAWLKNTFLAGKAQTLTVFRYETRGEAPDNENYVTKFYAQPAVIGG